MIAAPWFLFDSVTFIFWYPFELPIAKLILTDVILMFSWDMSQLLHGLPKLLVENPKWYYPVYFNTVSSIQCSSLFWISTMSIYLWLYFSLQPSGLHESKRWILWPLQRRESANHGTCCWSDWILYGYRLPAFFWHRIKDWWRKTSWWWWKACTSIALSHSKCQFTFFQPNSLLFIYLETIFRRQWYFDEFVKAAKGRSVAVIVSHPFHVCAVRCMAQFIGGETRYVYVSDFCIIFIYFFLFLSAITQ